jgi:hypothetical protein
VCQGEVAVRTLFASILLEQVAIQGILKGLHILVGNLDEVLQNRDDFGFGNVGDIK